MKRSVGPRSLVLRVLAWQAVGKELVQNDSSMARVGAMGLKSTTRMLA